MRRIVTAGLLGLMAAAPVPPWMATVVALSTRPSGLDTTSLPGALQGLADVKLDRHCQLTQSKTAGIGADVSAILPGLDCSTPQPVTSVQIQLHPISKAQIAQLKQALAAAAEPPCFDGPFKPDPRRRAPASTVTAWVGADHDVVLLDDNYTARTFSVSVLNKSAHPEKPEDAERYRGFIDAAENALPERCRQP